MVYHIILADILLIARNTTQLAKYPRVLYDKPSNKMYLLYGADPSQYFSFDRTVFRSIDLRLYSVALKYNHFV